MVKNWDFGANYWGDGGNYWGRCLGNYWGMGVLVTGQSQQSDGSYPRIKEVHSKQHSFQASLYTLTATHLTLIYVCTCIRLSVPLGCLIKQAGIIIHTNTGN